MEDFWEFEDSADRTAFVDSIGTALEGSVPGSSGTVPTSAMSGMNNENNFGVYPGVYTQQGIYKYKACFDAGNYVFTARDTYGDGWNGGKFSIKDVSSGMYLQDTAGSGKLRDKPVYGSQESFSIEVTGSTTLDCLVDWRQNCGDCIVIDVDNNGNGCDWCPISNQVSYRVRREATISLLLRAQTLFLTLAILTRVQPT